MGDDVIPRMVTLLASLAVVGSGCAGSASTSEAAAAPSAAAPSAAAPSPVALATTEAAPPSPRTFVGRWMGVGEQYPPGHRSTTWDVVAEIRTTDPGPCGTVEYPSLGCRGMWVCEAGFDGQILRAREQLTEGGGCVNGGQMEMTLTAHDNLRWRHSAQGIQAWATLSRVEQGEEAR